MKNLIALLLLAGCGSLPPIKPSELPDASVPDASVRPATLTVPARVETALALPVYAQLDGAAATFTDTVAYAFGDAYPAHLTLTPTGLVYVAARGCNFSEKSPTAAWKTLQVVSGDAATATLENGTLTLDLVHEGGVQLVLSGELYGAECVIAGQTLSTLKLEHTVNVVVNRVTGFVVAHPNHNRRGCDGTSMTLAAGMSHPAPTALPLNGRSEKFFAENAPEAVQLTLESGRDVLPEGKQWRLEGPGTVRVALATMLPVSGVTTFEVIGPEALVSATGQLTLLRAAAKGSFSTVIEPGASYPLFFPDELNGVELNLDPVQTTGGALCSQVPPAWFSVTSTTAHRCAPLAMPVTGLYGYGTQVANIIATGDCELAVTVPGSPLKWAASFTTTP